MNKKLLKKLMTEAGIYDGDDAERRPAFDKFAELIVLKCADVAFKHWVQHKGCSASFSIREHFGVER